MKYIISIAAGIFLLAFLITLPIQWQNALDYEVLNQKTSKAFSTIDKICESKCTDYIFNHQIFI